MENKFEIRIAKTEKDFSEAKSLFCEYATELNIDLCFQNFDKELKEISIQYNAPAGFLLLLKYENECIGCVGLRKINDEISEMKRMYVRKGFRRKGLSKKLIKELLHQVKIMGYKAVRLDTLPQMKEAINLYRTFGFKETEPYRFNPVKGTKYMELIV